MLSSSSHTTCTVPLSLTTNCGALWERAWSYKDHGKSHHAVYRQEHSTVFKWLHESIGTNWRMTEMQAALGRVALERLPDWLAARRRNAALFDQRLGRLPALRTTVPPADNGHAYYKYYVFVRPDKLKVEWNRDRIMNAVAAEGVPCFSGSCSEVYLEKAFETDGLRPIERRPVAKELGETSLMFLVHPTLTSEDMDTVARAVSKVMAEAVR